jgi:hypothetical protein
MSASYRIRRTTDIGNVGKVVSPAHGNRRTVKNTGSTNLELVAKVGDAFGTGYPLAPGAAFNFDDAGLMDGEIIAASESAGGACIVIGY